MSILWPASEVILICQTYVGIAKSCNLCIILMALFSVNRECKQNMNVQNNDLLSSSSKINNSLKHSECHISPSTSISVNFNVFETHQWPCHWLKITIDFAYKHVRVAYCALRSKQRRAPEPDVDHIWRISWPSCFLRQCDLRWWLTIQSGGIKWPRRRRWRRLFMKWIRNCARRFALWMASCGKYGQPVLSGDSVNMMAWSNGQIGLLSCEQRDSIEM